MSENDPVPRRSIPALRNPATLTRVGGPRRLDGRTNLLFTMSDRILGLSPRRATRDDPA